uniref:AlNc14C33G2992 protein n=1 Tax=Albugo laibachii Nc14 TaxID=890382 RepID=F0W898_9STRA|nr:AlNc14C33G2992 [Albugo laibachii Nc14]|eukprot:CCA17298.1 AlNc14C33G2992 [Albugo laibachii Nc14]
MRAENRSMLLRLDNFTCFPPNTTSYLQPKDAVIIRQFNSEISKVQNRRVVERFDALLQRLHDVDSQTMQQEIELLRQVDVLQAMRWAQDA